MMHRLCTLFVSLLYLAVSFVAKSSTGDSVLVVLEPALSRDDYSTFFNGLEEQGYSLTFRSPKDTTPAIIEDGVPSFAHIILFAPETKSYANDITPQDLVWLLSHGTNILFALGSKQTPLTSLAAEFSLILPPPGTPLLSHFPARADPPSVLPIPVPSNASAPILAPGTPPVWFSGTPFAVGPTPLLVPLLRAPAEAFASDAEGDAGADALVDAADQGGEGLWAGASLAVAAGFQTREGGRAAWVGGVQMFSDEYVQKAPIDQAAGGKSGNQQFAKDLVAWTFQESLVLRVDSTTHHKVGETSPPKTYTINDELTYTAHISKYNPRGAIWEPYSGLSDLQLEFTMLDPHVRTALAPISGKPGAYSVTFRAPDRHGVFKFVLDYKRKGWTHLHSETVSPVVPPRHDGYPRFLSSAWPYYTGAISTSIGFLLFSALWLAGEDRDSRKKKMTKVE